MAFKSVTVHSDGTGPGSVVVDEEGNKIEGIVSATIYLNAGEYNTVNLEILAPRAQVQAHVEDADLICPVCQDRVQHRCTPDTLSGT